MYNKIFAVVFILFSLVSCKDDGKSCDDIQCLNGGKCNDGECDCPEGYTSFNCSDQVEPSRILVTEVKVTDWPEQRINGDPWDSDSDPDILWELRNEQNQLVLSSDTVFQDAANGEELTLDLQPPLTLTDPKEGFFFKLMDEDVGNFKETMDLAGFRFYQDFNNFPDILRVQTEIGLEVEFSLTYEWD